MGFKSKIYLMLDAFDVVFPPEYRIDLLHYAGLDKAS